jgi:hypothetical protein
VTRRYLSTPLRGNPWRMWDPPNREPWQNRAACAGDKSGAWDTPPRKLPPHELRRLALACHSCPVLIQCLENAIDGRASGVTRAACWWPTHHDEPGEPEPWTEEYLSTGCLPTALFFANPREEGT